MRPASDGSNTDSRVEKRMARLKPLLLLTLLIGMAQSWADTTKSCHKAIPTLTSVAAKKAAAYDLQGLHLYEPLPEVLAHLAAEDSRFPERRTDMWSCASDWIEHFRSWREAPPGTLGNEVEKHCVQMLLWQGSKEELSIEFVEDMPSQPGCVVVKSISYGKSGAAENKASSEAWEHAMIEKYGPRKKYMNMWGDFKGPNMEKFEWGGGVHITLKDSDFADQRDKAGRDAIDKAGPVDKPKL